MQLPYMPTPNSSAIDLLNSAMRMPAPLDVFGPSTMEGPPQLLTTTPGEGSQLMALPACVSMCGMSACVQAALA